MKPKRIVNPRARGLPARWVQFRTDKFPSVEKCLAKMAELGLKPKGEPYCTGYRWIIPY